MAHYGRCYFPYSVPPFLFFFPFSPSSLRPPFVLRLALLSGLQCQGAGLPRISGLCTESPSSRHSRRRAPGVERQPVPRLPGPAGPRAGPGCGPGPPPRRMQARRGGRRPSVCVCARVYCALVWACASANVRACAARYAVRGRVHERVHAGVRARVVFLNRQYSVLM